MSKKVSLVTALVIAVSVGCNSSTSDVATAPKTNSRDQSLDADSEVPLAVADTSKPEAVVSAFLEALREGNDEIAEALLTTIARRETKEHELVVQPPGSPSASYEIGEVKHVQGGAHVNSIWSEYDSSGAQFVHEIVWVLRKEPIGWRVAGMATAVNPARPPIYLNFENVPDLVSKWQQADAELAAQAEQAQSLEAQTLQASQPGTALQR